MSTVDPLHKPTGQQEQAPTRTTRSKRPDDGQSLLQARPDVIDYSQLVPGSVQYAMAKEMGPPGSRPYDLWYHGRAALRQAVALEHAFHGAMKAEDYGRATVCSELSASRFNRGVYLYEQADQRQASHAPAPTPQQPTAILQRPLHPMGMRSDDLINTEGKIHADILADTKVKILSETKVKTAHRDAADAVKHPDAVDDGSQTRLQPPPQATVPQQKQPQPQPQCQHQHQTARPNAWVSEYGPWVDDAARIEALFADATVVSEHVQRDREAYRHAIGRLPEVQRVVSILCQQAEARVRRAWSETSWYEDDEAHRLSSETHRSSLSETPHVICRSVVLTQLLTELDRFLYLNQQPSLQEVNTGFNLQHALGTTRFALHRRHRQPTRAFIHITNTSGAIISASLPPATLIARNPFLSVLCKYGVPSAHAFYTTRHAWQPKKQILAALEEFAAFGWEITFESSKFFSKTVG